MWELSALRSPIAHRLSPFGLIVEKNHDDGVLYACGVIRWFEHKTRCSEYGYKFEAGRLQLGMCGSMSGAIMC